MDRCESFSTVPKGVSVLSWWQRKANALPILSEIARSVLAISASLAKSERVFSKSGSIVSCDSQEDEVEPEKGGED